LLSIQADASTSPSTRIRWPFLMLVSAGFGELASGSQAMPLDALDGLPDGIG